MYKILVATAAIGLGLMFQSRAPGQDARPLKFEVASIKPTNNDVGKGGLEILPGGGLKMGGVTLKQLISLSYGVPEERISGGPSWISSASYNVLAKPEHPNDADLKEDTVFAPGTKGWDRVWQRTQALLQDRFQMVIHRDSKEIQGYALVLAKGGSKLQPSKDRGNPGTMRSHGRIDGRRGTIEMLATVLGNFLGRPVVDHTGLTDAYDYKLEYSQEPNQHDASSSEFSGPSIFTAIQEQLGLKLEPGRVTTETIVIDRAERPSAN